MTEVTKDEAAQAPETGEKVEKVETVQLTFRYIVPEGDVYVTVLAAETDTVHGQLGLPRVQVHTDPQPTSGEPHGFVTIRGRKYRIDKSFGRLPDDAGPDLDGNPRIWRPEVSNGYREGYRNEHLVRINHDSRARDRLDAIVDKVLEMFETSYPGWRRESGRQAWLDIRRQSEQEAERYRDKLEQLETQIAEIDGKLAAYQ